MTDQGDPKADARLALCVLDAEDMYDASGPAIVMPPPGPRIALNYDVRGYITGTDALFRPLGSLAPGSQRVFYGLLLEARAAPGTFVAVIRGTSGLIEWLEDCEFLCVPGKRPGLVEAGFFGIYDTFSFRGPAPMAGSSLQTSIASIVGSGKVTVIGHSLGAALATYLAYDLAQVLPGQVALRVFASPHPGDIVFSRAVAAAVPDHVHYRNVADIVPRVPAKLGYAHLPVTIDLHPASAGGVHIKMNLGCLHHAMSYAALLDASVLSESVPDVDRRYCNCISVETTQAA